MSKVINFQDYTPEKASGAVDILKEALEMYSEGGAFADSDKLMIICIPSDESGLDEGCMVSGLDVCEAIGWLSIIKSWFLNWVIYDE